jgi:hypothetical protein
MEIWAVVLLIFLSLAVTVWLVVKLLQVWAAGEYKRIKKNPASMCDIDAFVGPDNPVDAVKVVLAHKIQIGSRVASLDPIPLEYFTSPHVENLLVSRRVGDDSTTAGTSLSGLPMESLFSGNTIKKPIIVCTIRMGFGHHRLAYSAASWAMQTGHPTVFHDLLGIKSSKFDEFFHTFRVVHDV